MTPQWSSGLYSAAMHLSPKTFDPDLSHAASAFAMPTGSLYLDSAAQGPCLRSVLAAGHAALDASVAPSALPFEVLEAQIETLRARAAASLFDDDVEGVGLIPSAAYGIATAARNLPLAAGDAVLVLDGQFPSNLLPWQQRCADVGARIVVAVRGDGNDWTQAVLVALEAEPRVRIVALPQAHWHDGALLDLDRIAMRVRDAGAALVLDLSQSLGALPVDLTRWQPDFIAAVGYKWLLGPSGLAWLWASPRWRAEGVAIEQHWSARDNEVWRCARGHTSRHRPGARRFDAGGVTDPLRVAMADAGLAQVQAWRVSRIARGLGALTDTFDRALDAHGLDDWKTSRHAPHFTALRPPPGVLDAVATAFARERIVCTRRYGLLRIAPHLHVDASAMERVAGIAAAVLR